MVEISQPIVSFLAKCKRVWLVLKKPTSKEFQQIAKVSALGILIIGLLGFLVSVIVTTFSRASA